MGARNRRALFDAGYKEGYEAGLNGATREDNPHRPGPYAMKHMGWDVGRGQAAHDLRQRRGESDEEN